MERNMRKNFAAGLTSVDIQEPVSGLGWKPPQTRPSSGSIGEGGTRLVRTLSTVDDAFLFDDPQDGGRGSYASGSARGKVKLRASNWRPVLLSCMIMASKVCDDLSMWNADFSHICAAFTLKRINDLEAALLAAYGFNATVPASEYAKYYFHLRSMAARLGGGARRDIKPLDVAAAKQVANRSFKFAKDPKAKPDDALSADLAKMRVRRAVSLIEENKQLYAALRGTRVLFRDAARRMGFADAGKLGVPVRPRVYSDRLPKNVAQVGVEGPVFEIGGSNPDIFNLDYDLHAKITKSEYFKCLYVFKTFDKVVDLVYEKVTYVEPWTHRGTQKRGFHKCPSSAFCLLLKLFHLQLTEDQYRMSVHLAKHEDMTQRAAKNARHVGTAALSAGAGGFLCCARGFYGEDDDLDAEAGLVWRQDATIEAVEEPYDGAPDGTLPRYRVAFAVGPPAMAKLGMFQFPPDESEEGARGAEEGPRRAAPRGPARPRQRRRARGARQARRPPRFHHGQTIMSPSDDDDGADDAAATRRDRRGRSSGDRRGRSRSRSGDRRRRPRSRDRRDRRDDGDRGALLRPPRDDRGYPPGGYDRPRDDRGYDRPRDDRPRDDRGRDDRSRDDRGRDGGYDRRRCSGLDRCGPPRSARRGPGSPPPAAPARPDRRPESGAPALPPARASPAPLPSGTARRPTDDRERRHWRPGPVPDDGRWRPN
ncbi:hypothetical protein JL722_7867 [Aureococcus anophagefferens]|nr:hypothetical protein JL722_7867 [Aureococcus anophagefferens]